MEDDLSILITTSGVGSRLGNFTKHSNKCLVRVGDVPAITHILNGYPKDAKFYITLGHNGDLVEQYLNIAHEDLDITFIDVDNYSGDGSSQGYSLLQAERYLQKPFIFHACDTLISGHIPSLSHNWCGGYRRTNSSHYSTLNVQGDRLKTINPKGELHYDLDYIGVSGFKDYKLFWKYLRRIYETDPQNSALSDCDSIRLMLSKVQFKAHVFDVWNDIGNVESLKLAKQHYGSKHTVLDKEREAIYFLKDRVVKFFSDDEINSKRIRRVDYLNGLTPPVLSHTKNFYSYRYADGDLAASHINEDTIVKLLEWAKQNLWINCNQDAANKEKCERFYFDKTHKRVESLLEQINKKDQPDCINGLNIPSTEDLLLSINKEHFLNNELCNFHGDFILDNIIITKDSFALLDWRQDFAGSLEHGDIYYDLSKLNHNIFFNHENIERGLYSIEELDGVIKVDLKANYRLVLAKQSFDKWCRKNKFDLNKINILTSIIWLNMAPLHEYPLNKFLYYFGRYNLFRGLHGK